MTTPHRTANRPRQRLPELEQDVARHPALGYEAQESAGLVRCVAHGFPTPLARWHFHEEYELHLIVATSGDAFVGDWVGSFEPGHLVLCGPRLPHNWVSHDAPAQGVAERDLVVQFRHEPLARAAEHLPELREVMQLLERARHGIEFFGLSELARAHWMAIRASHGLARFARFCELLHGLARCSDYRQLSSALVQATGDDTEAEQINRIVNRLAADLAQPIGASELAAELGMSESRFSRIFRRATGSNFTDFVNRARIHSACRLLMQTDYRVTDICYQVGFNNVANFNRRFLDIKGMTPSEFRRQANRRFGSG